MPQGNPVTKAQHIITSNLYMVLATSTWGGLPWSTPVFYAHDQDYCFYWYSRKATRHSRLIAKNPNIAITIYGACPDQASDGGVYMMGQARELVGTELPAVLSIYAKREGLNDQVVQNTFIASVPDFLGRSKLRMYKFTPKNIYVSNKATKWRAKWIDTRSKISLRDLRSDNVSSDR